jgi:epoxyqueuosine reductase
MSCDSREAIRRILRSHGFDRVGFARAGEAPSSLRLRAWVERGRAGTMDYMARTLDRREDPRRVLAGAQTVIAVALHYPRVAGQPGGRPRGRMAAYAQGTDYHPILELKLRDAAGEIARTHPGEYRYYVDTGPVLERDWAWQAGIGWIGKNTCAIDPKRGSYFFIGILLTTVSIEPDPPATDHCGTCTRCLDACPTGAIVGPRELDARRCISYLTIEHKGLIEPELEAAIGDLVFGCDICQEVCPFNGPRGDPLPGDPQLEPRRENIAPLLEELSRLDVDSFRARFPRSPVRRAKLAGLLRNVIIALGNSPDPESAAILTRLSSRAGIADDPVLRETLARALER